MTTQYQQGLLDAALMLAIYPEGCTVPERWLLDKKRKEILAAACVEESTPANPRWLGDGVTADMFGCQLRLSVQNGNANDNVLSECVIVMGKETCEGLARYMRQHVFCREEG